MGQLSFAEPKQLRLTFRPYKCVLLISTWPLTSFLRHFMQTLRRKQIKYWWLNISNIEKLWRYHIRYVNISRVHCQIGCLMKKLKGVQVVVVLAMHQLDTALEQLAEWEVHQHTLTVWPARVQVNTKQCFSQRFSQYCSHYLLQVHY